VAFVVHRVLVGALARMITRLLLLVMRPVYLRVAPRLNSTTPQTPSTDRFGYYFRRYVSCGNGMDRPVTDG